MYMDIFSIIYCVAELGHGGPLSVTPNKSVEMADVLMQASSEVGIQANPSYNSGNNQGILNIECLMWR